MPVILLQEGESGDDDAMTMAPSMMTAAHDDASGPLHALRSSTRTEVTFSCFAEQLFKRLHIAKEDRGILKPTLIFQVRRLGGS